MDTITAIYCFKDGRQETRVYYGNTRFFDDCDLLHKTEPDLIKVIKTITNPK